MLKLNLCKSGGLHTRTLCSAISGSWGPSLPTVKPPFASHLHRWEAMWPRLHDRGRNGATQIDGCGVEL